MKIKFLITAFLLVYTKIIFACEVCDRNQPAITKGWTHGAGPGSSWDWVNISIMSIITLLTLIFSIKFLVKPGEKGKDHIKRQILNHSNAN